MLGVIETALRLYGDVANGIINEKWSDPYYYQGDSGVRTVKINLRKHIPSYLIIGGSRAFVSYPGQNVQVFVNLSDQIAWSSVRSLQTT